ncbi:hypothetical protein [Paenibacillus sp. TCA20]|uniref:hypothetical protein n=1 Tax=Paenibacillus sp. TCA20 TaxID=1499968 RepID=UPI000A77DE4C|nr:hypothetical protein [Paenibacillus sp. TCA20]
MLRDLQVSFLYSYLGAAYGYDILFVFICRKLGTLSQRRGSRFEERACPDDFEQD